MGLLKPAELKKLEELLTDFLPFAQERMGYKEKPTIRFAKDPDNAQDPLGKTAYYEAASSQITVYIDGRHPKDIVRSVAHELVHHTQNGRGDLDGHATAGEQGYAQKDSHLREMEREAYEQGNLCFRDWEDSVKASNYNYNEGLDMWDKRNIKLNKRLMESFGYAPLKEDQGNVPEFVEQLVQMAAGDNHEAFATKEVEVEFEKYTNALQHALDELVPQLSDEMMNDEADYAVLMGLMGHGVGIWDGRWDHYEQQGVDLKDLEAKLGQYLQHYADDTGSGTLNDAIQNAAYETGSDEHRRSFDEAYQGAKTKGTKQAWGKPRKSEKKVERERDRKAGKKQTQDESRLKEAIRKVLMKNPHLIKILKESGMDKKAFVAQAWEKAGATSRTVSDEEAGSVESFNSWLEAEPSRQQNWEPAQSYRGGRVLAYNRKDQKYYDVQADMYVDDAELDAILPEGAHAVGTAFEPGDPVKVVASALTIDGEKTGVVQSMEAGAVYIKLDDDQDGKYVPADKIVKVKSDYVEPLDGVEGVTTMKEKDVRKESTYDVGSGLEDGPQQSKDPVENIAKVVQSVVDAGRGLFDMADALNSAGFKASAMTSPISMVQVETAEGMVAILSSKNAEDPDTTVGPYAIGRMNEAKKPNSNIVNTIIDTFQKKLNEYGWDDDDDDPYISDLENDFPWMKDKAKKKGKKKKGGTSGAEEQAALDADGEFDAPPEEEEEDLYEKDDSKVEGKLPPALQAAIDKKKGDDGDDSDDDEGEEKEDIEEGEEGNLYSKRDVALHERLSKWAVK